MKINATQSLLTFCFLTICTMALPAGGADFSDSDSDNSSHEALFDAIAAAAEKTVELPPAFLTKLEHIREQESVPEDFLISLIGKTVAFCGKDLTKEELAYFTTAKETMVAQLQGYKAGATTTALHLNKAFIVDTQRPTISLTFKNAAGKTRKRKYKAEIKLIGLNIELAARFSFIMLTKPEAFDFYASNKTIELGTGIEVFPTGLLDVYNVTQLLGQSKNGDLEKTAAIEAFNKTLEEIYNETKDLPGKEGVVGALDYDPGTGHKKGHLNYAEHYNQGHYYHGGYRVQNKYNWDRALGKFTDEVDYYCHDVKIDKETFDRHEAAQEEIKVAGKTYDEELKRIEKTTALPEKNPILRITDHIGLTYIPFKNIPGGMIMVTLIAGFPSIWSQLLGKQKFFGLDGGISLVRGGTLTPVEDAAKAPIRKNKPEMTITFGNNIIF